jgi:hypothetical protein
MTLDAALRELQNEHRNHFALWWKYVADSTELNAIMAMYSRQQATREIL